MSESLPAPSTRALADPRLWCWGLAAITALALATAHLIEALGYAPCPLCLYQRYPYYVAVPLLAAGALGGFPRLALMAALGLYLLDFGIAVFQLGVEQGVFALPESCAASGRATTLEELKRQLLQTVPRCDRPELFILGLSLASWNALLALTLALLSGFALGRSRG